MKKLFGAWFLVLGAWCLVLGAWCLVLGFENPEPGTRNPDISCFLPGAPPLADVKNRLPMSGAVYREVLVWVNYGR